MYTPYVRISNGSIQSTLDSVARNPVGSIYSPPANMGAPLTTKGMGAQPVYKYVYYNSTSNPAPVAAPAPVYYTDETFTTVSGNAAEAYSAGTGITGMAIAGYWMPNTTAIAGLTNTGVSGVPQVNQSYGFMQIAGFLGGAWAPTTATGPGIGSFLTGLAAGNWASVVNTTVIAGRSLGIQLSAIASNQCDVLVGGFSTFWGS
jgi:hypothetical protein